jgi:hypothetical protein
MMLGNRSIIKKNYILLGVYKNNKYYCGSYTRDDKDLEQITNISTGEVFHSLRNFVESILGFNTTYEWMNCYYYDDYTSKWYPMELLLSS